MNHNLNAELEQFDRLNNGSLDERREVSELRSSIYEREQRRAFPNNYLDEEIGIAIFASITSRTGKPCNFVAVYKRSVPEIQARTPTVDSTPQLGDSSH